MNLFLIADLGVGGSETKTVRLANALQARGRSIAVGWLSPPETLAPEIDAQVLRLPLERTSRFDTAAARRLARWIAQHRPSVIVCVNLYPTIYALPARWLAQKPIACVTLVNATEFANRKEAIQMQVVYRHTIARMQRVVYGCEAQRTLCLQRYGFDRGRTEIIYNGVALERFMPNANPQPRERVRLQLRIGEQEFVIGTVGAMRPEKAQADLILAVAALAVRGVRVRALVVGDGELRTHLESLARAQGIAERVIFAGRQADVRPFLQAMDAFAQTSLSETFSNAALEAMAMGVPVILSDVGGTREMIVPGESGLLFAPGAIAELASHVQHLIESPPARARLGAAARSRVETHFSFEGMLRCYEHMLDALSDGQPVW
jgi:glycosyltransferase involved in cell wall biosynthesis